MFPSEIQLASQQKTGYMIRTIIGVINMIVGCVSWFDSWRGSVPRNVVTRSRTIHDEISINDNRDNIIVCSNVTTLCGEYKYNPRKIKTSKTLLITDRNNI